MTVPSAELSDCSSWRGPVTRSVPTPLLPTRALRVDVVQYPGVHGRGGRGAHRRGEARPPSSRVGTGSVDELENCYVGDAADLKAPEILPSDRRGRVVTAAIVSRSGIPRARNFVTVVGRSTIRSPR